MTSSYLITGASGGIGLAMCRHLLSQDHQVHAVSRSASGHADLQRLAQTHQGQLALHDCDVSNEQRVQALAREIRERSADLDGLINCAGLLHDREAAIWPEKRIRDINANSLMRLFAINSVAPMLLAANFLPLLNQPHRTHFATLSARVGSITDNRLGGWYGYRASKAAQNQFVRTLAIEARRSAPNLVVLALHPGTTDTALSVPFQGNVPDDKLFSPDFVAERLLKIVQGSSPEDSGRFVAWDGSDIPW